MSTLVPAVLTFSETVFGRIRIDDSADPDLRIQFVLVHADLQAFSGPEINVADPVPDPDPLDPYVL